ncbi:MAG: hypothetical protein SAL07_17745 [Oscillatoria sp. PMC 1051.18]|uniref:hypothetical protein n=1 Tax=Oscillatoria salina TaxID=331517 RepID=UPI0013B975E9|nr:hypothetical protein [Oscillatoria salina]MBZ8180672.1 hypothetical protein [Oscillatoria salina IIICB1]MEC4895132.1 hypothetical protein [Oscillatoria sp. PMC 1050.18]MEC5031748.1 hypothetical protein [Oscillatoria sp. PMC 1051.18]NET87388.1 hypothetical protein [Kamptonema sp. SIO1D9]
MNNTIEELAAQVLSSRRISPWEQQLMTRMLVNGDLDEEDRTLIKRVFYGLRHGLVTVVK